MRLLRITGLALTLWALSALAFHGLGVRSWFRTPAPRQTEIRERIWTRFDEPYILWAGAIGITCLAVTSFLGQWLKRSPVDPAPEQPRTPPHFTMHP